MNDINGIYSTNEENLISAIKSCYKYPNYRVLVYTANMVADFKRQGCVLF